MVLRFFRTTGTQIIAFIIVLALVLWVPSLIFNVGKVSNPAWTMPLYTFLFAWTAQYPLPARVLALAIVLGQAFWLVRINTRFILVNNRTYMPALFFILVTALIPECQQLSPILVSGLFFLWAIEKLFDAYKAEVIATEVFLASFLISTGSLIYPYLIFYLIIPVVGLIVLRPFRWREWAFVVLGFLTPLFFTFSFYYLQSGNYRALADLFLEFVNTDPAVRTIPASMYVAASVLFVVIGFASQFMVNIGASQKILPRKSFTIFFWIFVVSILLYVAFKGVTFDVLYFIAVPLSFLFAQYFTGTKIERIANILLYIMFVALLVVRFF